MKPHPHRPPVVDHALAAVEQLVLAGQCRRIAVTLLYPLPPGVSRERQEAGDYVETLVFEVPHEPAGRR